MAWKACGFYDERYGKVFQMNWKVKDRLIVAIKRWRPESRTCRLGETYLQNIGYLYRLR